MDSLDKTCKRRSKEKKITYRIFYIGYSLGPKLQLKLTILNFWTKLTHKGYFQSKKE